MYNEQSVLVRAVPELIVGEVGWGSEGRGVVVDSFAKALSPRFAYQWPDNVQTYK